MEVQLTNVWTKDSFLTILENIAETEKNTQFVPELGII